MKNPATHLLPPSLLLASLLLACTNQPGTPGEQTTSGQIPATTASFREGNDYLLFERVRLLDRQGFEQPQEAFSILLPKGWKSEGEILWNGPGSSCAGTLSRLSARSADGAYRFDLYPDVVYSYNPDPQIAQFNQANPGNSPYCAFREPVNAEQYLRRVFAPEELGNAEVVSVTPNEAVVQQMQQNNARAMQEMAQYGAGAMRFDQTAVNAELRWPDGKEGLAVLGVTTLETAVPNPYTGGSNPIYTSQVTKRIVFTHPAGEKEAARNQFGVIMGSFRTNPAWNEAVNGFWRAVRQRKHVEHVGRIRMMDEQTRAMGEAAIRRGNERLQQMDVEMRNWEARQSADDRMHTNFIKTIREVEHYQDPTGKVELVSGYNHAWSRGDGSSFILSNNPNFDPSSVLQDPAWKEMRKVD